MTAIVNPHPDAALYAGLAYPEPYRSFLKLALGTLGHSPAVAQSGWNLRLLQSSEATGLAKNVHRAQKDFVLFVNKRDGVSALDKLCQYLATCIRGGDTQSWDAYAAAVAELRRGIVVDHPDLHYCIAAYPELVPKYRS